MEPAVSASHTAGMKLNVADRVIDLGREMLLDASGKVVELRPQAYQVLRHLALNAGRLVGKDELLAVVWPQVVVTDDSLVQAIGDARRALGAAGHEVLKTAPRRGYLLVADAVSATDSPAPVSAAPEQGAPPRSRRRIVALSSLVALLALVGIAAALWAVGPWRGAEPAVAELRPSIAVLAFRSPQRDSDGAVLARGFAEDLVSELARGPEMRVVSHQSSFQLVSGSASLAEIGQRLRSRYLVDGTVQREGEQLRIVVQLLDSEDGRVVWSSPHTVGRESLPAVLRSRASRHHHCWRSHAGERLPLPRPPPARQAGC